MKIPRAIKVVSSGEDENIKIMADRQQLRMAFDNLLRNAVEAMPEGGTLTVNVRRADDWAEVSVADTGQGISPENMPRLFEPLFTTKPGGVGFGLALAKNVVENHGGKIEAKSEPGRGAVFTVRLPVRLGKEER